MAVNVPIPWFIFVLVHTALFGTSSELFFVDIVPLLISEKTICKFKI